MAVLLASLVMLALVVIGLSYYVGLGAAQSRHIDIDVHPVSVGAAPARH